MQLKAYAKINLGLDVVGRRPDGYHEVRMVMQTIQMYDLLRIERTERPGIRLAANLPYIPCDERNLAYRGAKLLMDEFHIDQGVSMELKKVIPVAAGLAGGSADAAAAMVGVNRLFGLKLSTRELMERAVAIGADVPYCVMRGTALAEGIGERLTQLAPLPPCHILVGKPSVSVSTKMAYENLELDSIERHPDIDGMVSAIRSGDLAGVTARMENVFEPGIVRRYPIIREIRELMLEHGARNAMMSGSGPTVFGVFDSEETIAEAAERLRESHLARTVFAAKIFNVHRRSLNKK